LPDRAGGPRRGVAHDALMNKRILSCLALAALAACGKSSSGSGGGASGTSASGAPASGAPAAADGPQDRCEVHVTGDLSMNMIATRRRSDPHAGGGKVMAGTEYWMTDDDVHSALKTMAGVMSKKSDDEIAAEADAGMKKDPRLMLLLINCGNEDGHLDLGPLADSKYADVPFKPGTYRLVGTGAKPGDFGGMVGFTAGGKRDSFSISEPGQLALTKFDLTGIAGTFHFKAKNFKGDKSIAVDGSFDYGCRGTICK
jgi:hypothetical protein